MVSKLKTKAIWAAGLEVVALCLLACAAVAAPPGRLQSRSPGQTPVRLQAPAQRLDLRAPSHAEEAGNMAQKSPSAFPSMARRQNSTPEHIELPLLGADGMRVRPSIQEFVQKVHREGLPVARLFETKSALVHLGLSPRGKPGIWLVQKMH
ncbi:MAG TPA: hypothetical protein VIY68_13190 [Steroidobacteraceae bacterium]